MADSISFGNKGNTGKIDLSKVKAGIKKEDFVGQNKQLESIFDSVDKDGNQVLDRNELQDLQTKLTQLAGDDARLSKGEAKKFIGNDGQKLGRKNRDALYEFLNKLSAGSQDVKSITTQNINGHEVEVITYNDGHTEELYPDGTKITMITNGNKTIVAKEDKDGKRLSQTEKTIEDGVETIIEYDGETPKSKTVTDTKKNTVATYKFDGDTPVLIREENTESGDIITYKNGVKTTTKADGQVITEKDGVTTTTSADGNTVTTSDGTKTEIRVKNTNSETLTTIEDDVETVVTMKDGKNISQTITKDGESISVEYDGNGNTKGVIVQNGESPAAIAKKFGCSVKDLMEANKDLLNGKRYFQVGEEIVIPGEMNADEFAKLNAGRQSAEETKAQYTYDAQIRAEKRAAAAAQEKAKMKNLGIVNRNGAGTVINSETKPTKDGKFKNFNKNAESFRKLTYTVVGETGNRGRMVVKASNGKYYTMAQDGMVLDEGYAVATKAFDAGQSASRNDGRGRKVVIVDGKQYVFSQDGKLLKSDYVKAADTLDSGAARATASGNGVSFVRGEDGTIRYFDKNGKLITGEQRQQLIKTESRKAADIIYKAANGLGTDEEKLQQGIDMIYSPEIMKGVNTILKSKDSDYAGDAQTTPIEALLLDELSRSEVRQYIKTLAANGAYGTGKSKDAALGRNAAREIQYEVHGGVLGYTGTADLKEAMGVASTRGARLATEEYFKDGKVKGGANDGSMVRQYIAEDGWDAQEVDQFDATWIKNNAYDSEHDQAHRNSVVGRLIFDYDNDEALHTGLDAVDSNPDSEDYKYLTQRAVEANKANGYKAHFTNQEAVQTYFAGRTANKDGSVDAAHVSACNTLLFKGEKPARVQAEEILYSAQNGDMSTMFDSMEPKVYTAMADLIAKGDVKGCTSVKEAYDKVMSETTNINDKTKIKANAILSGQVEFSDAEIADFCIELMHRIDENRGTGASSHRSAESTNIADYETEQLKAILQNNPQIAAAVKAKVQAGEFSYTKTSTTFTGPSTGSSTTSTSYNTKNYYLNILNESKHVVSEAVFLDTEGKQITDSAQIKALTEANMNALKDMREYVAQLEREFKKGVDAEGAFSDGANWLSTYSGLGTDRSDVATEYRNAKLLLNQLEAAAQGKLRDSEGKVISAQDLAQSVIDKGNALAKTNSDYKTTIQTAKMGMVLAPVILVTTVATGGTSTGFWTGAVIAGGATAGTEYGLNTIERVTSITGDTAEAREEHAISAMVDGVSTFIGVGQMKFIPKILNNAGTFIRAGGRLATVAASDIGVGAAGEYVQTGTVTVNGVAMNAVFSVTGNLIGLKSLSEKHVDVNIPHADVNVNSRDVIADGEVARNIDLQHVDANQRRMVEEGLKDVPTPEELGAYQKEMAYQAVPEADRPAFEAHQRKVATDYANAHRMENNAVIIETAAAKAPKEAVDKLAEEIKGLDGNIRRVRQQMEGARRFGKDTSRYEQQLKNLEAKRAGKQAELKMAKKPADTTPTEVKVAEETPARLADETPKANDINAETIINETNTIPEVQIPQEHKALWKNCKERIEKLTQELSMPHITNPKELIARGKELLGQLKTIADSIPTVSVKAKIQKIASKLKAMLTNKISARNSSKPATEVPTSEIRQLTPQERMEMGQISNNINRAKTAEDIANISKWLDKMPECSQKTALQNQLAVQKSQLGINVTPANTSDVDEILAVAVEEISPHEALVYNLQDKLGCNTVFAEHLAGRIEANPTMSEQLTELALSSGRAPFEIENLTKMATPENIETLTKLSKNKTLSFVYDANGNIVRNDFELVMKIADTVPAYKTDLLDIAANTQRPNTDIYQISQLMSTYPERSSEIALLTKSNGNIKVGYDSNNNISTQIEDIFAYIDQNPQFHDEIVDFMSVQRRELNDYSNPVAELETHIETLKSLPQFKNSVSQLAKDPNLDASDIRLLIHRYGNNPQQLDDVIALSGKKYSENTINRAMDNFEKYPELRSIMLSETPTYRFIDANPQQTPMTVINERSAIRDRIEASAGKELEQLQKTLGDEFYYKVKWEDIIPANASDSEIKSIVKQLRDESKFFARTAGNERKYGKNIQWAHEMNNISEGAALRIGKGENFDDVIHNIAADYRAYDEAGTLNSNAGTNDRRKYSGAYRGDWYAQEGNFGASTGFGNYPEYKARFTAMANLERTYNGIELTKIGPNPDRGNGLYMLHPTNQNVKPAMQQIGKCYDNLQPLVQKVQNGGKLSAAERQFVDDQMAEMYFLMGNVMPWARGSNGISDLFMRSTYKALGIDQPALKKGVSLDLEAFCMDINDYKTKWKTFFEAA